MRETIRILGIDPGSRITGFGVVDLVGARAVAIEWGSIRTEGEHRRRLETIFRAMTEVIRTFRPTEIAIEQVFVHRNADSALKLGQARAAAICATFATQPEIHEYAARHIKKAVVGRGGAEKAQVQHMVRTILGIREEIEPDAADALAVAICHAHTRAMRSVLLTAMAGS